MNQSTEDQTPIECPQCEGTGVNPSRVVRGRLSTASSAGKDHCTKCGGSGELYPVNIELEPAETKIHPSLGGPSHG